MSNDPNEARQRYFGGQVLRMIQEVESARALAAPDTKIENILEFTMDGLAYELVVRTPDEVGE